MKITIAMGFFLPVPPARGGATEKSWHRLAEIFAARGHSVTLISRRWGNWPDEERREGVHYLRLGGFDHRGNLPLNLLLDLRWSLRVRRAMPAADLAVIHGVTLPALARHRWTGNTVLMPGRMPKGQYRLYRDISRVLATSRVVRDRVIAERPEFESLTKITGYPIDCGPLLAALSNRSSKERKTITYVGRLHPEKGLDLLVEASCRLRATPDLPPWRLVLCGPEDTASGGGGASYVESLRAKLSTQLPADSWAIQAPRFEPDRLAEIYGQADVFCYPSLAANGETFGVAIAEAMAAGAIPVVSRLECFQDLVSDGVNGIVFDHESADPAGSLTASLATALRQPVDQARTMSRRASESVGRLDFPRYAQALLADFSSLARGTHSKELSA